MTSRDAASVTQRPATVLRRGSVISRRRRADKEAILRLEAENSAGQSAGGFLHKSNADKPAIEVKTHLRVVNLIDMDTMNERFTIHLVIIQEWDAPETEEEKVMKEGCDRMDVDWEPEWYPRYELVGSMNTTHQNEFYSIKTGKK